MLNVSHIVGAVTLITMLDIALSAMGAVVAFHQRDGGSFRDFLAYVFPRDLVTRRSCWQDLGFIIVKQLIKPFTSAPLLLLTSAKCAILTYGLMILLFGPRAERPMSMGLFVVLVAAAVLTQDFLRFYSHYLFHRFSVLWDIHKVHHSAGYLTPLTNHRVHIIEEMLEQAATGLSVGPLLGLAAFATETSISTNALLGFDAYVLIDALCFSMLRHSHIGLSFNRFERFLLSPKQHHLHHSTDRKHWDKNFGFIFAFWDRIAGTICYSNPREMIAFGITDRDAEDYGSVLKLHFMPFVKIARAFWSAIVRGRTIANPPSAGLQAETLPEA
ncbi:MAG TPA: sterol desaturase family protein [Rhodopila sp.]|jgi:sterol desaturase/sphingolipid hydroxylase (fatty acid hydroxylase superfamily)|nr:sterol desaturase family protein [Rhodopila sp.]